MTDSINTAYFGGRFSNGLLAVDIGLDGSVDGTIPLSAAPDLISILNVTNPASLPAAGMTSQVGLARVRQHESKPVLQIGVVGGTGWNLNIPVANAAEFASLLNQALVVWGGQVIPVAERQMPTSPALGPDNLITYGHSFLGEQPGVVSATSNYFARRLASALGLNYPTAADGTTNVKRAVNGTDIRDTQVRVANTSVFTPGTKALVLLMCLINTSRQFGWNPVGYTGALNAGRAIMAMLNAQTRTPETDASFTYSGTWTTSAQGAASGGTTKATTVVGAYVQFTAPAGPAYISTMGRGPAVSGGATLNLIDVTASNTTLLSLDLTKQAFTDPSMYVIRIPDSAAGHTVKLVHTGGTSLYFNGIFTQAKNPNPVLWVKDVIESNWPASTQFPLGSDAVSDYYNTIIDVLAAEFPNIIPVDPKPYWKPTSDVSTQDYVHPNDIGNLHLALACYDALVAWSARQHVAADVKTAVEGAFS